MEEKEKQYLKTIDRLQRTIEKRDYDLDWVVQYYENKLKEADDVAVFWRDKCDSVIRKAYKKSLLNSNEWREKRQDVFILKGERCAICGGKANQIHHIKYEKGLLPWEYEMEDLVPLCQKCHYNIHQELKGMFEIKKNKKKSK